MSKSTAQGAKASKTRALQGGGVNRSSPLAANRRVNNKTEGVQNAILDTAAEVFAAKGFHLTKLTDISEPLGLHVTALRYHFPSKDSLAEGVANRVSLLNLARLNGALEGAGAEASSREKIAAGIRAYVRTTAEAKVQLAAHGNIVNQLSQEARARHYLILDEFMSIWRRLVAEAAERGELRAGLDPAIATQVLLGSLIWTREWYQIDKGAPPEAVAEQITDALFGGLMA